MRRRTPLPLDTPARVLGALSLGCFATMGFYAIDALVIWQDWSHAAPEFGRYGVAFAAAAWIYQWSRRRAASEKRDAPATPNGQATRPDHQGR